MIKRLTDIITKTKTAVYKSSPLRIACYLCIAAALLLVYLYTESAGISFVYNEF